MLFYSLRRQEFRRAALLVTHMPFGDFWVHLDVVRNSADNIDAAASTTWCAALILLSELCDVAVWITRCFLLQCSI